jgi:integrase/recombinase XerD
MNALIQRMLDDMRLLGRSPYTMKSYANCVKLLERYHGGACPSTLSDEQIRQYFLHLHRERRLCVKTIQVHVGAIRFLLRTTLGRPVDALRIIMPRRARRIPVVLSRDEAHSLVNAAEDPRSKAMVMLLYGAGLRVGEMCNLRVSDIDGKRMLIRVVDGKGCKTRQVMLSPRLLQALREYWAYRPRVDCQFLLLHRSKPRRVRERTVALVVKALCRQVGIKKRVTPHTLRHSFATHLVEAGVDLRTVQLLLGHQGLGATMVYVHLSNHHLLSTVSPLDNVESPEGDK